MLPPPGYATDAQMVFELKKAIYGLKQASLTWYRRLSIHLERMDFRISLADPCVFWKKQPQPIRVFAHIDNLIIVGNDLTGFREEMASEFDINYSEEASFILKMNLVHQAEGQAHR